MLYSTLLTMLMYLGSGESGRTLIDLDADTIDIGIKESIKVVGRNVPHDNGFEQIAPTRLTDTYIHKPAHHRHWWRIGE